MAGMTDPLTGRVRTASTWSIVISVLMIVAGVFAIIAPVVAGFAVTAVVGWLLLFSGVLHLIYAWREHGARNVVWEILLGIVYGWIGIYLIAHPVAGLATLTLALALYLFIEGILELVLSFQIRPAPGAGWVLFDGIVTLILAAMIWATWPSNTPWVIGTIVGISMLLSGIARLAISIAVRRVVG